MEIPILHIKVEIEPGEPTPAQLKNWRDLWAKLLSKGQEQTQSEAEKGLHEQP
jgi:hypothetical protein